MERTVFRWLTGAGVIAAVTTFAVDTWGDALLPSRRAPAVASPPTTVLVFDRNGAKLIPYAVCTVARVGE